MLAQPPVLVLLLWNSDSLLGSSRETALLNRFKVGSDAAARIPDGLAEEKRMEGDETPSQISSEMAKKGGEGKRSTPGHKFQLPNQASNFNWQRSFSDFSSYFRSHLLVLGVGFISVDY